MVPAEAFEAILADAAAAAAVDRSDLRVVRASSVRWPDGSLGCPDPGMVYTQALVDGWQLVLGVGDRELDYRGGRGTTWRRCLIPGPRLPPDPGSS
jgi:hypothetical protein